MKHVRIGCQVISVLFLITILVHWKAAFVPLRIVYYLRDFNAFAVFLACIGFLFVLLNVAAAVGVYKMKNWGFAVAYTAIIFSTIFFSVSYIPFIDGILPNSFETAGLAIINLVFLAATIYMHVTIRHVGKRTVVKRKRKTAKR